MREEPLEWVAEFSDGAVIEQYDDDGKEHSFREVMDRQDDLVFLGLKRKDSKDRLYWVDLRTGAFFSSDGSIPCDLSNKKLDFRPVNFRRWTRRFGMDSGVISSDCELFMGYQATDNGKNVIRLLRVTKEADKFKYELVDRK